ncbi:MAG TPA: YdeI/OmpD-associated family protein [Actinomycetota bacterium]|nr:YdeI/OmpD-associated family protein [Actinomycetota bacterium]
MAADLPELIVADAAAWRAWLAEHGREDGVTGVWLVLAKKNVTDPTSLTYDEALDEALCEGWIDGQVDKRDERTYRQRWTPRRAKSKWSERNVGLVGRLIAEGRMRPAGQAEIDRAKADGRWEAAYHSSVTSTVPADLAEALTANPAAHAMFEALTRTNRYAILYRIQDAKRPETRAKRVAQFVDQLARGETPHPQKKAPP